MGQMRNEELHQILDIASGVTPFFATHGEPYVSLLIGEFGHQVCPIASPRFHDWLFSNFDQAYGRPPSPYYMRQALRTLEARASAGLLIPVHRRIAGRGDSICIQLHNQQGQHIEKLETELRGTGPRVIQGWAIRIHGMILPQG